MIFVLRLRVCRKIGGGEQTNQYLVTHLLYLNIDDLYEDQT